MLRRAPVFVAVVMLAAPGCGREAAMGRPWVHKVFLNGVQHVDKKDLRKKLALEQTSWIPLAPKKYLDPFTVDADRARIEAYYRVHGYFGARVTAADVKPYDHNGVDVHLSVEEGPPTLLTTVTVAGLEPLGPKGAKLAKDVRLKVGTLFNHEKYLGEKDLLEGKLKLLGYAWATVDGKVEINRDTQTADVTFTCAPGQLARFGHVHVHGTDKVDPRLIALHTGIAWGDKFDPETIEDARGKIYNLGLFSAVRVEYQHIAENPDIADVVVTVKEGTFRELRIGGGLGIESLRNDLHASVIYTRNNFLGGLRTLKLSLSPAYVFIPAVWNLQRQGPAIAADATLIQPDVPWALSTLRATIGYDVNIDYAYQYHGPRAQLGWSRGYWHDHVQLDVSYNFQYLLFFNTDPAVFFIPSLAGRLFGYVDPYRLGYWSQSATLDLRDHPLDAHSGFYFSVTAEEGGDWAAGAFQYEKILPDARAYLPLGKRITVAVRAQFGQMFTQGSLGSPVTRRFFLGGPNSHRGFSYNRLSMQVPSMIYGVPPIPLGGDEMLLLQGELRVNVMQLFGQWLALAAFFDAGDVAAPQCAADPSGTCGAIFGRVSNRVNIANLHYAAGGGIRYKTLIGTIRFDLGVRLNRLSDREPDGTPNPDPGQRFAFHISVGESF